MIKYFKNKRKIKNSIKNLTPELIIEHNKCLAEGFKDKVCPKCGVVYLAHHHFINCELGRYGECPIVSKSNPKSILQQLLD